MTRKKSALLAAGLNFLLPGLGYLYAKSKRPFFAWGLFVLSIAVAIHDYDEITRILTGKTGLTEHFMLFIILYPIVFAWDAYRDAKDGAAA